MSIFKLYCRFVTLSMKAHAILLTQSLHGYKSEHEKAT